MQIKWAIFFDSNKENWLEKKYIKQLIGSFSTE